MLRRGGYDPPRMRMTAWDHQNLLQLEGLSREDIVELLDAAERHVDVVRGKAPPRATLAGRIVASLFFEDSTRTRGSFAVAAQRLGAAVFDLSGAGSSVSKGETIVDTALTIEAMGVDGLIVRARPAGAAHLVAEAVRLPVINAGDGRHEHPTQGLLDLLTMRQHLGDMKGRTVAIVGDIANSRVARSNLHALTAVGANVVLIGPPTLVGESFRSIAATTAPGSVEVGHELDPVLPEVDVIMMLRVQFERDSGVTADYRELYGLTRQRAARLKPEAIVMHPGPMNRGLEIDSEVADDPTRSVIRAQVTNGVAVRMAVLELLLAPG